MKNKIKDIFDEFLANSLGLICVIDNGFHFVKVNHEWETTFGFSNSELEGEIAYKYFHPDDLENVSVAFQQLKIKNKIPNQISRYSHKNGSYRSIEWNAYSDEEKIYVTAHDLTDQMEAELNLLESEKRNRFITSLTSDYIFKFIVNKDKKIKLVYISDNFGEITGRTIDEVNDIENWDKIFHKEDLPNIKVFVQQIISNASQQRIECRSFVNGNLRWIEIIVQPETDIISGEVVSVTGVVKDITTRKKAEKDISFSEKKFRSIFENSTIGIALVGMDGKYLMVNQALCKIMGYSSEELLKLSFFQLTHPDDFELSDSTIKNVIQGEGKELNISKRYIHKDGRIIWTEISSRLLYDDENNPLYFITHVKDINERKEAEEALRKSEEQIRTIAQNIPGMIFQFTVDKNGKYGFNYISDHSMKYFGLENKDRDSFFENFLARISKKDRPRFLSTIKSAVENFSQWDFEGRYMKSDGNEIYFKGISLPRIIDGKTVFDGVTLDITDRKKIEKLIADERNTLRTLIDNIPDFVYVKDRDCKFLIANKTLADFVGRSVESLLGKSDLELFSDELSLDFYADDRELIRTGKRIIDKEEKLYDGQGNLVYFLTNKFPLYNVNGEITGLVGSGHMITERKRAEEKITLLNAELERKVEERTIKLNDAINDLEAFAYSISHDLRAPIRHINGFIKLMYSRIPDPTDSITGYYSKIETATTRMSSMIDSLLYFSRLGKKELSLLWIDLGLIVKEIIDELKPDVEERQIQWNISSLPHVQCDKDLMRLVFENLISNAIKYTSRKKKAIISIGFKAISDDVVEIYVKDNGIGFNMAYSDKLFGVFQRLHSSDEFEGIGIGLANARQIIIKHRGTIRAEGKINKGAVFYITLPTK